MNLILAALPEQEWQRLEPLLQVTQIALMEAVIEPDVSINYVYFPLDLVASAVTCMRDGSAVETVVIGFDGMVGVQAFFGQSSASTHTIVQVPGSALRMRREDFQQELHDNPHSIFSDAIADYVNAFLTLATITAGCNRIHQVEQRLARWLKMTHNRAPSDVLPMRHDFMAHLLGVQRPTVSIAAHQLKRAGLIQYEYGRICIVDATGLEARACECYGLMEKHIEEMYGKPLRKQSLGLSASYTVDDRVRHYAASVQSRSFET